LPDRAILLIWFNKSGREPINLKRTADVRFGAHSGPKREDYRPARSWLATMPPFNTIKLLVMPQLAIQFYCINHDRSASGGRQWRDYS
jgi:hypothetical protein